MPRSSRDPALRHHKASGQAAVVIDGRWHYLGKFGTDESRAAYHRLLAEWRTHHAQPDRLASADRPRVPTLIELIAAYWEHTRSYYRKDGEPTSEVGVIKQALRVLKRLYGRLPADQFGPLKLQAVRDEMVRLGWCRSYVNRQVHRVRRMFRWAASVELVPSGIFEALMAVEGLHKGRTAAPEREKVRPVPDEVIEQVLPHLPPVVAAMVRLQRLTGMRAQEVVAMRGDEIDRSDPDCWSYRPGRHKTEHHDRDRVVFLGPRARGILAPFLLAAGGGLLFSPERSEADRNAERREQRRVKLWPSHTRRKRQARPKRQPGECYTRDSYRRAIERACSAAFPHPALHEIPGKSLTDEQRQELRSWRRVHRFHPHQLRHSAATEVRARFGLEAAQVVLGHAELGTAQIYAERDMAKAREVARKLG